MENDILEMIERLYADVSEAWGFPLGNDKCIIERTKFLADLDDIKASLPTEMAEAKRLVSAKEEYISNAKREADSIKKLAEERARHMVEEQEIMRCARVQSKQIMEEAEQSSKALVDNAQYRAAELRRVATDYLGKSLRESEAVVEAALRDITQVRQKFETVNLEPAIEEPAPQLSENDIPEELKNAID